MDFSQTPEMASIRGDIRAVLADALPVGWQGSGFLPMDVRPEHMDLARKLDEHLGKKNLLAPAWPKEYGGRSMAPIFQRIADQEMRRQGVPIAFNVIGLGWAGPLINDIGTEQEKEKYLRGILSAEDIWCQGFSEPDHGSDLGNAQCRAVRDGDEYVINGTKIWTTMAHIADWIFCLTRTSDAGIKQEGITFLLFPMKQEGIEVKPIITLGGSHTVNTVFFSDVKVPVENLVGEEGKGWTYAKGLLEHERTGIAGISNSIVALEDLKQKASSVKRGNGSLMDVPSFKAKIAELEIDLMAVEYTELRSLATASAGTAPGPESSILKLKGTEIQQRIQKLTMEAGGQFSAAWGGTNSGPDFARGGMAGYMGSRVYTIYGGASEVQKDIITKKVLGIKSAK